MKKTCSNCGCLRYSGNKCIDMTCWIGYVDGDHDGWTPGGPKKPEWGEEEEITYRPFENLKK